MKKEFEKRIWELDFLRGLSILLMVFDHLMYDLKTLRAWLSNYFVVHNEFVEGAVNFATQYWNSELRKYGHWVFVDIFLLVSGISFTFSRSNLKRSLKFAIAAIVLTAVTWLAEEFAGMNILIVFGIIHMFAVCTFLTWLLRKIWNNDLFILILGFASIFIGVLIHWYSVEYLTEITFANFWRVILGINGYGADFFGIFPQLGFILIGTVIGNVFYRHRTSLLPHLDGGWNFPFVFAGRHSFAIFLFHQPIVFGLIYLITTALGYHF
jgi:uncharacterized membrane protein